MLTTQKQKEKNRVSEATRLLTPNNNANQTSSSTSIINQVTSSKTEAPGTLNEGFKIDDIIIDSSLKDDDASTQANNILRAFNRDLNPADSVFTTTVFPGRGERLNPGEFYLGFRNIKAELKLADPRYRIAPAINFNPQIKTGVKGRYMQNEKFFGACGSFVLNVPVGHYAKAYKDNNVPLLFGPGPHVIHNSTFKFNPTSGFVNQNANYINHETIHILRVPAGKIAKIWIGSDPHLLESRPDPYVFNSAQFQLDGDFVAATEKLITHGHIKRVMPDTGEAAISKNNGVLTIIHPREDYKPTIINSAAHRVEENFINTGIIDVAFPSKKTIDERKRNNPNLPATETDYEKYTTKEGLRIGVKILVIFQITDAKLAFSKFSNMEDILKLVENLAKADMGKALQGSSTSEYLNTSSANPITTDANPNNPPPFAPQLMQTAQDQVQEELGKDLLKNGLTLIRFNIEETTILDEDVAKKLNQQSLTAAAVTVLKKQSEIAESNAKQQAMVQAIDIEQRNKNTIETAKANLEAAKINAQATQVEAEAKLNAALTIGKQYVENPHLLEIKKLEIMASAAPMLLSQPFLQSPLPPNLASAYATPFTMFNAQQLNLRQPEPALSQTPETEVKNSSSPSML